MTVLKIPGRGSSFVIRDNFKFAVCPNGTFENAWVGRTCLFFHEVKQVLGNPTHRRTVRFQEKQDHDGQQAPNLEPVRRIGRRQDEQELALAFRGLPPKWKKFIEQKPHLEALKPGLRFAMEVVGFLLRSVANKVHLWHRNAIVTDGRTLASTLRLTSPRQRRYVCFSMCLG